MVRARSGFSLVEMVVVLAVVAILGLLGWFGYGMVMSSVRQDLARERLTALDAEQVRAFQSRGAYLDAAKLNELSGAGAVTYANSGEGSTDQVRVLVFNSGYGYSAAFSTGTGECSRVLRDGTSSPKFTTTSGDDCQPLIPE